MYKSERQVRAFHDEEVNLPSVERKKMRERRNVNRDRLVNGLVRDERPAPIGQHTQGSYAMHTMVQDSSFDYDIDDGAYFRQDKLIGPNGGELSALAVRQMVCDALQDRRFGINPEVKKNCVRVYYREGFHVDVPAYRRIEKIDPWTNKPLFTYELASSEWKASDPRAVTRWFKRRNEDLSPDYKASDGQFCRIVRMLKAFARSRSSWKPITATGFMITKLASDCFVSHTGRDDISLRETMLAIRSRLAYQEIIDHPTMPGVHIGHDGDGRPAHFRGRLAENLKHLEALDADTCTHGDAMAAWDKVFCTGWFSQQGPSDDDDDIAGPGGGSRRATAFGGPNRPVEKKDGGRYANQQRR